jgi:hypothetical protein
MVFGHLAVDFPLVSEGMNPRESAQANESSHEGSNFRGMTSGVARQPMRIHRTCPLG